MARTSGAVFFAAILQPFFPFGKAFHAAGCGILSRQMCEKKKKLLAFPLLLCYYI